MKGRFSEGPAATRLVVNILPPSQIEEPDDVDRTC